MESDDMDAKLLDLEGASATMASQSLSSRTGAHLPELIDGQREEGVVRIYQGASFPFGFDISILRDRVKSLESVGLLDGFV